MYIYCLYISVPYLSMNACMYGSVCTYMCKYACVFVCTNLYIYIYIHGCIYVNMQIYSYSVYVSTYYIRTHLGRCVYMYMHICGQTYVFQSIMTMKHLIAIDWSFMSWQQLRVYQDENYNWQTSRIRPQNELFTKLPLNTCD